jgi:hypothetical protein
MTNFRSLKTEAEVALAKLTEGKKFMVGDVKNILRDASEIYPQDTVIVAMANVVDRICSKNEEGLISQGELERLFQQLVGLNASGTRFRDVLGHLLISERPEAVVANNNNYIQSIRDDDVDCKFELNIDADLKNGLGKLFNVSSDKYDPHKVAKAKERVESELRALGFDKSRVKLASGNSEILVFSADLDTNNGSVGVLIPTKASGQEFPKHFMSSNFPNNSTVYELTVPALNSYLSSVSSGNLLQTATFNQLDAPKMPVPNALKSIASEIEENIMEVAVGYSPEITRLAKKMVIAELHSMGFKNSQIRVALPMKGGFICEATINTPSGKTNIEVPIEINGTSPLMPTVFAKNDYVAEFNTRSLKAFAMSGLAVDAHIVRYDNSLDNMDLSELKNLIIKSALEEDFDTCDEAIAVIANKFDDTILKNAIADYTKVLTNISKTKSTIKQAYDDSNQFMMTPNSMYPVHKKLGRPAHELIRDENGTYHLKSTYIARQAQQYEGAIFNTAKVLLGD